MDWVFSPQKTEWLDISCCLFKKQEIRMCLRKYTLTDVGLVCYSL